MNSHLSVLTDKVVEFLITGTDGIYVDATLGDGGHSIAILSAADDSTIIAIDKDKAAIEGSLEKTALFGNRIKIFHGDFAKLESIIRDEAGIVKVDGVLFDLGLRIGMLEDSRRGFSFKRDGPLDMRFDRSLDKTAYEVVNKYSLQHLSIIFSEFGDIKKSEKLARQIVEARKVESIKTTLKLAEIVSQGILHKRHNDFLARIFQAIRIEVNDEYKTLETALKQALEITNPGGRIVVISYHSGEDRIVKNFFAVEAKDCICPPGLPVCRCGHRRTVRILTRKPICPSDIEINKNSRARSAKLRAVENL